MMMGFDILLVVAVGAAAYALGWRPQVNKALPGQSSQSPLDVLKQRYASGDITREEYDQVRRDLEA